MIRVDDERGVALKSLSNALPIVGSLVAIEDGALPRSFGESESLAHLGFGEERGTLKFPVRVFLIDGRVMFARDLAAFHHE